MKISPQKASYVYGLGFRSHWTVNYVRQLVKALYGDFKLLLLRYLMIIQNFLSTNKINK